MNKCQQMCNNIARLAGTCWDRLTSCFRGKRDYRKLSTHDEEEGFTTYGYQARIQELELRVRELTENLQLSVKERDEALTRLSAVISSRVCDNNPDICNLSDQYRPVKLAEISSELYDNEWTDAFDYLEERIASEPDKIGLLLDIVLVTYLHCKLRMDQKWEYTSMLIGSQDDATSSLVRTTMKERKKEHAEDLQPELLREVHEILSTCAKEAVKDLEVLSKEGPFIPYVTKCVKLCLHMVVQDPPVVWYCPGWSAMHFQLNQDLQDGQKLLKNGTSGNDAANVTDKKETFNRAYFREYMKSGHSVDYFVWPAMLLYQNGPLLTKGVAQGYQAA